MPLSAKSISPVIERGFTLVELVMTLVIIAILSVFVVSRLDFKSTFDERAYHDKLKAGLQFARKAAVAQRRYVCVGLVAATGIVSFTVHPGVPEGVVTPSCTIPLALPTPDSSCSGTICRPSGVLITAPAVDTNFWFDARGASSAAVTFSSTGPFTITVEPETGYVH